MRPRLEVRAVVADAARELVSQGRVGVTWREVAHHTQVAAGIARETFKNMARAGELARVGTAAQAGARRPMTLYAPATQPATAEGDDVPPLLVLDDVLRGWLPGG